MRLSIGSLAFAGLALLPAVVARADTFNFSAIGAGGGFSGSGVLTGTNNGDGSSALTDISGTGVTGLASFNGGDNLLFPDATRLVDVNGFSFTEALAGLNLSVNIFSTVAGYEAVTLDTEGDYSDTPVTFTIANNSTVTPEPASLLLLGSGLLGMAVTGVRRRLSR